MSRLILALNSGSSSIKCALVNINSDETVIARGELMRIGLKGGSFKVLDWNGNWLVEEDNHFPGHEDALKRLFEWLRHSEYPIKGIGHRVVTGGPRFRDHQEVSQKLIATLKELQSLSPLHLPPEILGIEMAKKEFPLSPQVACFDTAFHKSMPPESRLYALPPRFEQEGIFRYGYHGLSYEYITTEIEQEKLKNVVMAHLGNGASMAAVQSGRCLDTTMGFTPAEGLVMGTRAGDLDPGVMIYLASEKGMTPGELRELVNEQSGLKGVSELSSDVQVLLEAEKDSPKAAEALLLFCYRAKKAIGALAAALGGLDALVFTAGIGEHSAEIRRRICTGLEHLGIELSDERNKSNQKIVSKPNCKVKVFVIPTDEELMMARHTHRLLFSERTA